MKNKIKSIASKACLISLTAFVAFGMVGCKKKHKEEDNNRTYYDNETDKLTFSTQEVDKLFNPFFSTSGTDSNVVGMTQISMLGNDSKGNPTYGDEYAVVTKDLEKVFTKGTAGEDDTTTYYFVLKNNVRYSNGSYLSIKDVLFNLYVYLDPSYTGSSTIYSTDIVGLQEYRTDSADRNEQESFKQRFQIEAQTRIDALVDAAKEIIKEHKEESLTNESFIEYLTEYTEMGTTFKNVLVDYNKACELFRQELESDYTNAKDGYIDLVMKGESGKEYKNLLSTDVESFLYNENYITWNKKEEKLESSLVNNVSDLKSWTKEQAINTIYADKIPSNIEEVVSYWATAVNLETYLEKLAMDDYYQNNSDQKYKNISGIQFANRLEDVTVNGVTYKVPEYDTNGNIKEGFNEVLSIKIKDVDPKAIWNFAFSVAPMYYYSDETHIKNFDFVENFGVEKGSIKFMDEVIQAKEKQGVPMGAGAYAASKSSGGIENIKDTDFYDMGLIYFERNPYFVLGPAKIKKVRFQVVAQNQMLNALYNHEIDFVEPNAKPETIQELVNKAAEGFGNTPVRTAGYGYIGINAGKVPDMEVRQAIMHSIDILQCVNYYRTTADPIYRSMSKESWAYPKEATSYYPYIGGPVPEDLTLVNPAYANYCLALGKKAGDKFTEKEQIAFIRQLVEDAGYEVNGSGVYQKGNHRLSYTFTVAGETQDHPAWNALYLAGKFLNKINFDVNVKTDSQALKKLSSGQLTVWAAAWGSTIDPDMYQVYHKESSATSTLNWGYKQILQNADKYNRENAILDDLSDLIERARKTDNQTTRARLYSQALDLVMELAVELPTYQRNDLFAYDANKIDTSTFTPNDQVTAYKGLTSDLWNVSLYTER